MSSSTDTPAPVASEAPEGSAMPLSFGSERAGPVTEPELKEQHATAMQQLVAAMKTAEQLHEGGLLRLRRDRERLEADRRAFEAMATKIRCTNVTESGRVKLNVGGRRFEFSRELLEQAGPDSMLAAMFSGRHELELDADGSVYVDRSGKAFAHIDHWMRTGLLPPVLGDLDLSSRAKGSCACTCGLCARFRQLELNYGHCGSERCCSFADVLPTKMAALCALNLWQEADFFQLDKMKAAIAEVAPKAAAEAASQTGSVAALAAAAASDLEHKA